MSAEISRWLLVTKGFIYSLFNFQTSYTLFISYALHTMQSKIKIESFLISDECNVFNLLFYSFSYIQLIDI